MNGSIHDMGHLLNPNNAHTFNPATIRLSPDTYLIVVREIKFRENFHHPWDMWFRKTTSPAGGSKTHTTNTFIPSSSAMEEASSAIPDGSSSAIPDGSSSAIPDGSSSGGSENNPFVPFSAMDKMEKESMIPWTESRDPNEQCVDGSRFLLVKKTGNDWKVLRWSKIICRMVDTRVYPWNPLTKECQVTYSSSFYNRKKEWKEVMVRAKLSITKDSIRITDKKRLLPSHFNRKDKNCVLESLLDSNRILYHVEQGIEVISDGKTTTRIYGQLFLNLKNLYGEENFFACLGTPPVLFTPKTKLMVGHLKMRILESYPPGSPMEAFRQRYFPNLSETSRIRLHHKLIYFMVFIEYDFTTFRIVRHSMAFIPSFQDNHIPYLLVFPMSVVHLLEHDEFQVWYGEGDTRCKVLTLHRTAVEGMLYSCEDNTTPFDFTVLYVSEGTQNIPVFQTFSKETNVVNYHQKQYPSLDFRFFDDASVLSFLEQHFDEFIVHAYQKINPLYDASRADFFKYCVLYVYGGVYMDIKAGIKKDFTPLLTSDENVLIVGHWKNPFHADLLEEPKGEFMNWVILATKPENPVLGEIIVEMVRRIQHYDANNITLPATMNDPCSLSRFRVLVTTGPIMMSQVLLKHRESPHLRILPEMEDTFAYVSPQCTKMGHGEYADVERSVPYILE